LCFPKEAIIYKISRLITKAALAMAFVAGAAFMAIPANASTIDWTLSGVTFNDGGTASGTFSTDSTTGNLIAYDITTMGGSSTLTGVEYKTATGFFASNVFVSNSFVMQIGPTLRYLEMAFINPLTNPGVDQLVPGKLNNNGSSTDLSGSWESNNSSLLRNVVSGEAVSQTPLPAALPLFAGGLSALGLLGWRRKRNSKAVLAAT